MYRAPAALLSLVLFSNACARWQRAQECRADLVFDSNRAGLASVYRVSSTDERVTLLTPRGEPQDYSRVPDWSPDGRQVVFQGRRGNLAGLFVIPCGGGTATFLAHTSGGGAPAWSPDGLRIAFVRNAQILVVDVTRRTVSRAAGIPDSSFYPAWSPDGSTLAFVSRGASAWEVFTLDTRRGVLRQLTHAPAAGISSQGPAWAPDGKRIAFDRNRGEEFDIYVMNSDGTDLVRLTHGKAVHARAVWSPDGETIAFHSNRDRAANATLGDFRFFEIYTIHPDGAGIRRLTTNDIFDGHPDWP